MGFSQLCEAWIMEDNPNHDPSNGEFSSGGGSGSIKTIPQGHELTSKADIQFKNPKTGRTNTIKAGSRHWVGNSETHQKNTQAVEVVKRGSPMGHGFLMGHEMVRQHFHVEGE